VQRIQLWMTRDQRTDVVTTGYATTLWALRCYLERWRKDGESFRKDLAYPEALEQRVEAAWKLLCPPPPAN
jgi:hypothetical protein